jgi:hypothetical protein
VPKPRVHQSRIVIRPRVHSREVASFFAQLDELSGSMFADLAGCSAAELAWQGRRGMNTIGMLLAHDAIVEVSWLLVASGSPDNADVEARIEGALGVDPDLDGMPLAAGAAPPGSLAGWTLARYRKLHDRARTFAKKTASAWRDTDLEPTFLRRRADGSFRNLNLRWILYHVLEHQAGHYGQMLLLRHEYRDRLKKTK